MDDPQYSDLFSPSNPGPPGAQFLNESPVAIAFKQKAAQLGVDPNAPIGPGGHNAQGLAYSWLPYDPLQSTSGIGKGQSHTKFGPTYDDPVWGKLQSTYTEPSKAKRDRDRLSMAVFGTALGAITMGAASPFLGPAFSSLVKYGSGGGFDPKGLALSLGLGAIPGGLGALDPALAQAYNTAKTAFGVGSAGYQASKGNYAPGAGIALRQMTGG